MVWYFIEGELVINFIPHLTGYFWTIMMLNIMKPCCDIRWVKVPNCTEIVLGTHKVGRQSVEVQLSWRLGLGRVLYVQLDPHEA